MKRKSLFALFASLLFVVTGCPAQPPTTTTPTSCPAGLRSSPTVEVHSSSFSEGERAETGPSTDLVVVDRDSSGVLVRPDLAARVASPRGGAAVVAGNELTFTYNSPSAPWTSAELSSLQAVVASAYPIIKAVVGPPLFPITVNFRKDPTLPPEYAGAFYASGNEIAMPNYDSDRVSTLVHEIIHAFRDDLVMGPNTFEEGMTRAAEDEVLRLMPAALTANESFNHSYVYDVYYDALNDPRIGAFGGHFWVGRATTFSLLRYQLAGYAWGKAIIERPDFFSNFNASLYAASRSNPTTPYDESALVGIAASVAPTVEGRDFATWYGMQGVLDTSPPTGDILYHRARTPDGYTIDAVTRSADGLENLRPNITISWSITNSEGAVIDSGADTTTDFGLVTPRLSTPATNNGRVRLAASAVGSTGGTVSDAVISTTLDGAGVFGAVPRNTAGTVTITPTSPGGTAVCAVLQNGAFDFPTLASARGTFNAVLEYSDGTTYQKTFTKGASRYYLKLH